MIEVTRLNHSYENNQVLDNINFSIKEGKITTILGANGSGKSTLLSVMSRSLKLQTGEIRLHGKKIQEMKRREFGRQVAIVQQVNNAPSDMTVEKLVSYGRIPYEVPFKGKTKKDLECIEHALKVTGLLKLRHQEISKISGGEKQRAFIAMALAQDTKILFLDEPTTYLDIRYQIEILEMIKEINQKYGTTIVMILHDINQAITYSDYLIGLKKGEIVVEGITGEHLTDEIIESLYGIKLQTEMIKGQRIVLNTRESA